MSSNNLKKLLGLYNSDNNEEDNSSIRYTETEYEDENLLNDINAIYQFNNCKRFLYIIDQVYLMHNKKCLHSFFSKLAITNKCLIVRSNKQKLYTLRDMIFNNFISKKFILCNYSRGIIKRSFYKWLFNAVIEEKTTILKLQRSLRKIVNRAEYKSSNDYYDRNELLYKIVLENIYRKSKFGLHKGMCLVYSIYKIISKGYGVRTAINSFISNLYWKKNIKYFDLYKDIVINEMYNSVTSIKSQMVMKNYMKLQNIQMGKNNIVSSDTFKVKRSIYLLYYIFKYGKKYLLLEKAKIKRFDKWRNYLIKEKVNKKISQYQLYLSKIDKSKVFFIISYILIRYKAYANYFIYRMKTLNNRKSTYNILVYENYYNNVLYHYLLGFRKIMHYLNRKSFIVKVDSNTDNKYNNSKSDKLNCFSLWKIKNKQLQKEVYGKLLYYRLITLLVLIFKRRLYHYKGQFFFLFITNHILIRNINKGLAILSSIVEKQTLINKKRMMMSLKSIYNNTDPYNSYKEYLSENRSYIFIRSINSYVKKSYIKQYFYSFRFPLSQRTYKQREMIRKLQSYESGVFHLKLAIRFIIQSFFTNLSLYKPNKKNPITKYIIENQSTTALYMHDYIYKKNKVLKYKKALNSISKYYTIKRLNTFTLRKSFNEWKNSTLIIKTHLQMDIINGNISKSDIKMRIIEYIESNDYIQNKIHDIEEKTKECSRCNSLTKRNSLTNNLMESGSDYNCTMNSLNEDVINKIHSIPVMNVQQNNIRTINANKVRIQKYPQIKNFPTEEDENNGWDSENNELIDLDVNLEKENDEYYTYLDNLENQIKSDIIGLKNKYEPKIISLQSEVDALYQEVESLSNEVIHN